MDAPFTCDGHAPHAETLSPGLASRWGCALEVVVPLSKVTPNGKSHGIA